MTIRTVLAALSLSLALAGAARAGDGDGAPPPDPGFEEDLVAFPEAEGDIGLDFSLRAWARIWGPTLRGRMEHEVAGSGRDVSFAKDLGIDTEEPAGWFGLDLTLSPRVTLRAEMVLDHVEGRDPLHDEVAFKGATLLEGTDVDTRIELYAGNVAFEFDVFERKRIRLAIPVGVHYLSARMRLRETVSRRKVDHTEDGFIPFAGFVVEANPWRGLLLGGGIRLGFVNLKDRDERGSRDHSTYVDVWGGVGWRFGDAIAIEVGWRVMRTDIDFEGTGVDDRVAEVALSGPWAGLSLAF